MLVLLLMQSFKTKHYYKSKEWGHSLHHLHDSSLGLAHDSALSTEPLEYFILKHIFNFLPWKDYCVEIEKFIPRSVCSADAKNQLKVTIFILIITLWQEISLSKVIIRVIYHSWPINIYQTPSNRKHRQMFFILWTLDCQCVQSVYRLFPQPVSYWILKR